MKKQKEALRFSRYSILCSTVMIALLLSSCNYVKNHIFSPKHLGSSTETEMLSISLSELENIAKLDRSYFIYFSSDLCEHCNNFLPIISSYVKETQILVYNLKNIPYPEGWVKLQNLTNSRGVRIFSALNESLPIVNATPTLCVVNEGSRVYDISRSSFSNLSSFKSTMSAYYKHSSTYVVSSLQALGEKLKDGKDFIISTFDSSRVGELDSLNVSLFQKSNNTGKPVYFVDLQFFAYIDFKLTDGIDIGENKLTIRQNNNTRLISFDSPDAISSINDYFS